MTLGSSRKGWKRISLAAAIGIACAVAMAGGSRNAMLTVSATVSPSVVFELEVNATPMVVSGNDIRRGYIEVDVQSRLAMTTADRHVAYNPDYVVSVAPRTDIFRSLQVAPSPPEATQAEVTAKVNGNGHGKLRQHISRVRYRFELVEGVAPGRYSQPLFVAVNL